jgi:hypothetical protein
VFPEAVDKATEVIAGSGESGGKVCRGASFRRKAAAGGGGGGAAGGARSAA